MTVAPANRPGISLATAPALPFTREIAHARASLQSVRVAEEELLVGVREDLTCVDQGAIVCACDDSPVTLNCIYGKKGRAPQPVPNPARACVAPSDAGDEGGD